MEPLGMTEQKVRCQSCGMPMTEGYFGTEADGSPGRTYCRYCYQQGAFTEPGLTLDQMIQRSVRFMVERLKFPAGEAEQLSRTVIPTLKRWQS